MFISFFLSFFAAAATAAIVWHQFVTVMAIVQLLNCSMTWIYNYQCSISSLESTEGPGIDPPFCLI